jgi:membrane protease YdiL (CAAX protease family)
VIASEPRVNAPTKASSAPLPFLPIAATILVAAAHAFAWRAEPKTTWLFLAGAYLPLVVAGVFVLHRDEVLGDLFKPRAGDLSKGIGVAGAALVLLYGAAILGIKLVPAVVGRDLQGLVRVAVAVPTATRGIAVVLFAALEELVWRGAVAHSLEERLGTTRARWASSILFVVAVVPSLHPSLIVAAVLLGAATAWSAVRFRTLVVAVVVHAFFSWITVEMLLPTLWQRLVGLG